MLSLRKFFNILKKNMDSIKPSSKVEENINKKRPAPKKEFPKKKPRHVEKYEGEYYFDLENGFRMVYPYKFEYRTYVKRRWIGEPIDKIYRDEFRAYEDKMVAHKFKIGEIRVNNKITTQDHILLDGDTVTSVVHRHEAPVLATPLEIIADTDEVLVINKPSSIPVHPCGKYRLNSILAILSKEYGYKELFGVHRLDRLTSGLLIFAKNSDVAKSIASEIRSHTVSKEYVCRVEGEFPDEEISCDQPIDRLCHKLGVHYISNEGKESLTVFKRIAYDGNHSIVLCQPKTGRTHQIRIHLQYLGFPIANDPLYNCTAFGSTKGKHAQYEISSASELKERVYNAHPLDQWIERKIEIGNAEEIKSFYDCTLDQEGQERIKANVFDTVTEARLPKSNNIEEQLDALEQCEALNLKGKRDLLESFREKIFDPSKFNIALNCEDCRTIYKKPRVDQAYIYLHALRYKTPSWEYFAEPPRWAHLIKDIDFKNL